ncbi:MAG TPA: hypothetical protein VK969_03465, partial [Acidimicrobiia bacterium]|nr:hypothetical protein [Acidimicrobiia bacterium]
DLEEATRVLDESLAISRRIGRKIGVGRALWALGNLASYERDWGRTEDYSQQAVSELRQIDAPFDLGWAWFMIAHSRLMMSRAEAAKEPLAHALEIFARVRDVSALALILTALAMLQLSIEEEERAAFFWGASQRLQADTGVSIGDVDVNQYPRINEFINNIDAVTQAVSEEGYNASVDEAVEMARVALGEASV